MQPAAKAVKAPAKKEESSSEEESDEDSEMEDAVSVSLIVSDVMKYVPFSIVLKTTDYRKSLEWVPQWRVISVNPSG